MKKTIIERINNLEKLVEGKLSSQEQFVEELKRLELTLDRIDRGYASSYDRPPEWWSDLSNLRSLAHKLVTKHETK